MNERPNRIVVEIDIRNQFSIRTTIIRNRFDDVFGAQMNHNFVDWFCVRFLFPERAFQTKDCTESRLNYELMIYNPKNILIVCLDSKTRKLSK